MKEYKFKINGKEFNVGINSVEDNIASVTVNGADYNVELGGSVSLPKQNIQAAPVPSVPSAPSAPVAYIPPISPVQKHSAPNMEKAVTSPLPGVIISVNVKVGDTVRIGQEVAVLEAMKMENSIEAIRDGIVTAVHVSAGDSILGEDPIITIG